MSAPLTLYMLRHGEVFNPQRILYGRMPGFYLSDVGRHQAIMAGRALKDKPISAMYSSPMERAQETATLVLGQRPGNQLAVQVDPRLNECHTPFDGTPHEKLEKVMFDIYTGNEPPHECPADLRVRALEFIAEMRTKHAHEQIAFVTHGDIVVTLFLHAMGQELNDIGRGKLEDLGLPERYPMTASINTLTYHTDDPDEVPEYHYLRPY
ncbi:histidine phosphatase family protein [Phototrophicus methaneseepsis]|uniref:Histidine phosphatase family protein n=1 Tax=Phototrophicus methaneseepsis TaxID=2710758 RepID=A0A7S8EDM6_9CHLR|nr:histidine phosphatase family protein [Phototrophicus methaneseepsis]QPC84904.1 histidine phosphatase family protein [Phototrophicus methaneseepsis]